MTGTERGQKVKLLMEAQDMTMARLSRKTGLHINTIRNVVTGNDISVKTLQTVANGLSVSPAILI